MNNQSQQQKNPHSNEYQQEVYNFLQNGKYATYTIDRICRKENQKQFVEIIKDYIDTWPDCGWEFTTGFKKIRRVNLDFSSAATNKGIYN